MSWKSIPRMIQHISIKTQAQWQRKASRNNTLQREKKILPGASSGPRTATIAFIRRPTPC